jgi:hypothetical protein
MTDSIVEIYLGSKVTLPAIHMLHAIRMKGKG